MAATPVIHSPPAVKDDPKGWSLTVVGYSTACLGLVAFLTINGSAGLSSAAGMVTAILIVAGLVIPAFGMLQKARVVNPVQRGARRGLDMQAAGLVGLLVGVILIVFISSFSGYVAGAGLVAVSGVFAFAGVSFFRKYAGRITILALGTILIFLGVELIAISNVAAADYLVSQLENTILADVGATVTAYGCVVSAYTFFVLPQGWGSASAHN